MYTPIGTQVKAMFASIAHRYDITNTVLSLGVHHLWKRHFIRTLQVDAPQRIMDVACGTGDLVPLLHKQFGGQVLGVDFCEPMLDVARKNYPDFEFLQGDALNLNFADDQFDLVTVSFGVRNFENLEHGLKEILRVLKSGGVLAILEFGQPENFLFGENIRMVFEIHHAGDRWYPYRQYGSIPIPSSNR